jgi:WD40 repeat protein
LRRFAGRRGQTHLLQFSGDGKLLAAGSPDGVQLWEVQSGKRLPLAASPRCRVLDVAFSNERVLALGSDGQALVIWDVGTGKILTPADGHHFPIQTLAFSGDGKSLCTAGADGWLCWWDVAGGKEQRRFLVRDEDSRANIYRGLTLSPDSRHLATMSDVGYGGIRLLDLTSGRVVCDFEPGRSFTDRGAVQFSPDARRLVARGTKGIQAWDISTGQEQARLGFKETGNYTAGSSPIHPTTCSWPQPRSTSSARPARRWPSCTSGTPPPARSCIACQA